MKAVRLARARMTDESIETALKHQAEFILVTHCRSAWRQVIEQRKLRKKYKHLI